LDDRPEQRVELLVGERRPQGCVLRCRADGASRSVGSGRRRCGRRAGPARGRRSAAACCGHLVSVLLVDEALAAPARGRVAPQRGRPSSA